MKPPIQFANIPDELRERPQWVTWKYDEHNRKIPYSPRTGKHARTNDPATWATFTEACHAAQHRHHSGLGYVFSDEDPFVGIDLDDCITAGELAPWAREIIDTMHTYTEQSPSGTGVKLWVKGSIPTSVKTSQIEIYSSRRYFTVTGNRLHNTPAEIQTIDDQELMALFQKLRPPPAPPSPHPLPIHSTDADAARRYCLAALEGEQQKMLAAGDGERHNRRYDSAHALAGLLHTGGVTETEIFDALALNFGPDRRGAEQTIRDGIAAGRERPRDVPPPRSTEVQFAILSDTDLDDLDDLDADTLKQRLRSVMAERDQWKQRAHQLQLELGHVQERNRFVTQASGAEGIGVPSMRLTFMELKKELDRVPLEEREPDQFVHVRPAYMAKCVGQNRSTISRHLGEFEAAGLIEKKVERTYDPETKSWCSETFVRPLVDLSDPSQVSIPVKPRGKAACRACGSTQIVRQVRISCADCGHEEWSVPEPVNAPEPEVQIAQQYTSALAEAISFFDEQPNPQADDSPNILKCRLQHKERTTVGVSEVQNANQGWTPPTVVDPATAPGVLRGYIDQDDPWFVYQRSIQASPPLPQEGATP